MYFDVENEHKCTTKSHCVLRYYRQYNLAPNLQSNLNWALAIIHLVQGFILFENAVKNVVLHNNEPHAIIITMKTL